MARPKKNIVTLTNAEVEKLQKIARTKTAEARTVQRAKILLGSFEGMSDTAIAEKLDISRQSVNKCINKYRAAGVEATLEDSAGRGRPSIISDDEKAWIVSIACQKPIAFGYAQELWTMSKLQYQIQAGCEVAGYPGLLKIAKSKIWNILNDAEIKPHKIRYYLERRDPEFEKKMEVPTLQKKR